VISYSFLSPAKINLVLEVLRRREDGYHEIYGIFQKITLFDEIEIFRPTRSFELDFVCEEALPLEKNLIYRAYKLFKEKFSLKEALRVRVLKRIPLGAGLGGGSSNAGTILKALAKIYEVELKRLFPLARALGADVPFFLSEMPTCEVSGIGEILKPYPNFQAYYLLIYPGFKVETAWAYKALNLKISKEPVKYGASFPPWEDKKGLINDFKALLYETYPVYRELERFLIDEGALAINLTGTGSVLYGVFKSPPLIPFARLKKIFKGVKIYLAKNLE